MTKVLKILIATALGISPLIGVAVTNDNMQVQGLLPVNPIMPDRGITIDGSTQWKPGYAKPGNKFLMTAENPDILRRLVGLKETASDTIEWGFMPVATGWQDALALTKAAAITSVTADAVSANPENAGKLLGAASLAYVDYRNVDPEKIRRSLVALEEQRGDRLRPRMIISTIDTPDYSKTFEENPVSGLFIAPVSGSGYAIYGKTSTGVVARKVYPSFNDVLRNAPADFVDGKAAIGNAGYKIRAAGVTNQSDLTGELGKTFVFGPWTEKPDDYDTQWRDSEPALAAANFVIPRNPGERIEFQRGDFALPKASAVNFYISGDLEPAEQAGFKNVITGMKVQRGAHLGWYASGQLFKPAEFRNAGFSTVTLGRPFFDPKAEAYGPRGDTYRELAKFDEIQFEPDGELRYISAAQGIANAAKKPIAFNVPNKAAAEAITKTLLQQPSPTGYQNLKFNVQGVAGRIDPTTGGNIRWSREQKPGLPIEEPVVQ